MKTLIAILSTSVFVGLVLYVVFYKKGIKKNISKVLRFIFIGVALRIIFYGEGIKNFFISFFKELDDEQIVIKRLYALFCKSPKILSDDELGLLYDYYSTINVGDNSYRSQDLICIMDSRALDVLEEIHSRSHG